MDKIKVGIIGASGYAGAELVRLLLTHPGVEIASIGAKKEIGHPISTLYPGLYLQTDLVLEESQTVIDKSDFIFISLPHGLSEKIVKECQLQNKKCIDLGADFRLEDEEDYKTWYQLEYQEKDLHKNSVYGLSEWQPDKIKEASIIGNPGCYPTSIALGMMPLLKIEDIDLGKLIIDSKSGTTGAGKELKANTHFPRCNESFGPYSVGAHRHLPEIIQTLSKMANKKVEVVFVPHLLPINRGIISTMYISLDTQMDLDSIHQYYQEFYKHHTFVRVLPLGKSADLKFVLYSNYCDISLHLDPYTQTLIVVTCIDNMVKGAAGQAIQNMNLMCGFIEKWGLTMIPPSF